MSTNKHYTGKNVAASTHARVVALPVSSLPVVGIIILLGLVLNILTLIIR